MPVENFSKTSFFGAWGVTVLISDQPGTLFCAGFIGELNTASVGWIISDGAEYRQAHH